MLRIKSSNESHQCDVNTLKLDISNKTRYDSFFKKNIICNFVFILSEIIALKGKLKSSLKTTGNQLT